MKWTEEKIKTFWIMKDSGSTLTEIARELGCTKNAVNMKAIELRNKAKKEKENAKMAECNESEVVEQKIEEPEAVKKFDDFFAEADKKVWHAAGGGSKYGTAAAADVPSAPVAPTTREEILDAAKKIVTGDREKQYGKPEDNFAVIARFWEVYLSERCVGGGSDVTLNPDDVAMLMALMKVARIMTGTFKGDSYIDACGYLACAAEIAGL